MCDGGPARPQTSLHAAHVSGRLAGIVIKTITYHYYVPGGLPPRIETREVFQKILFFFTWCPTDTARFSLFQVSTYGRLLFPPDNWISALSTFGSIGCNEVLCLHIPASRHSRVSLANGYQRMTLFQQRTLLCTRCP